MLVSKGYCGKLRSDNAYLRQLLVAYLENDKSAKATAAEIGKTFGVSAGRIYQIYAQAKRQIIKRAWVHHEPGWGADEPEGGPEDA